MPTAVRSAGSKGCRCRTSASTGSGETSRRRCVAIPRCGRRASRRRCRRTGRGWTSRSSRRGTAGSAGRRNGASHRPGCRVGCQTGSTGSRRPGRAGWHRFRRRATRRHGHDRARRARRQATRGSSPADRAPFRCIFAIPRTVEPGVGDRAPARWRLSSLHMLGINESQVRKSRVAHLPWLCTSCAQGRAHAHGRYPQGCPKARPPARLSPRPKLSYGDRSPSLCRAPHRRCAAAHRRG